MKYYSVFYRKANSKNNFCRMQEEYVVSRGRFKGSKDSRDAKYTLETAESLVKHLESEGYEAKIKETQSGTFYERHYAQ